MKLVKERLAVARGGVQGIAIVVGLVLLAGGAAVAHGMIGPEEIKDDAVRPRHLNEDAVRSRHLEDGTVRKIDLSEGAQEKLNEAGPQGPPGAPGFMPTRVAPDNLGIWETWKDLCTNELADARFVNGDNPTPPLGAGAFQVTGTDGNQGGAIVTSVYNGMTISQITALRYSTKSEEATDQFYIYINLDDDDDNQTDRTIYFFPANNESQGPVAANLWQTWDARAGKWNIGGDTGPGDTHDFSEFNSSEITGVRFAAGCGPSTGGVPRTRATDDVEIGTDGDTPSVFDFERV
jgi:hypothetical protein